MASPLALHNKTPLGGKSAPQNVVNLAGNATEPFRQLFSPERKSFGVLLFEKFMNILLNDSCQARHDKASFDL
jgi:hypothetical protein